MGHQVFSEELVASVVKELQIADLAHATIGRGAVGGFPVGTTDGDSIHPNGSRFAGPACQSCRRGSGEGRFGTVEWGAVSCSRRDSRTEARSFALREAFVDIDISPRACIPTTGSVAASFGAFVITTQCVPGKDKVLFIDPGFPIQKSQLRIIGAKWEQFDIYHYRGER